MQTAKYQWKLSQIKWTSNQSVRYFLTAPSPRKFDVAAFEVSGRTNAETNALFKNNKKKNKTKLRLGRVWNPLTLIASRRERSLLQGMEWGFEGHQAALGMVEPPQKNLGPALNSLQSEQS